MVEFSGGENKTSALVKTLWRSIIRPFPLEQGKQVSDCKSRNHAIQRMWNKISYSPGTEPTLNHAISIVSNLNCFPVMFFSQNVVAKYFVVFLWAPTVKRAWFLHLLNVLFLHSLGCANTFTTYMLNVTMYMYFNASPIIIIFIMYPLTIKCHRRPWLSLSTSRWWDSPAEMHSELLNKL